MSKYEPLTRYLESQPGQEHALTFQQVEAIIVGKLPSSAYRHRAWWSNNPKGHVMAEAWVKAGWKTSEVDMEERKLKFRRIRNPLQRETGFAENPPAPLHHGSYSLTVSGLDETTLSRLQAKADLQGRSVEEVAREILRHGATLTAEERLALADRIRAMSPSLHDIDVVAMIREDRDSR
jgi:plasmid stability protein